MKITFGEMREDGTRDVLIYCRYYRCDHHVETNALHLYGLRQARRGDAARSSWNRMGTLDATVSADKARGHIEYRIKRIAREMRRKEIDEAEVRLVNVYCNGIRATIDQGAEQCVSS